MLTCIRYVDRSQTHIRGTRHQYGRKLVGDIAFHVGRVSHFSHSVGKIVELFCVDFRAHGFFRTLEACYPSSAAGSARRGGESPDLRLRIPELALSRGFHARFLGFVGTRNALVVLAVRGVADLRGLVARVAARTRCSRRVRRFGFRYRGYLDRMVGGSLILKTK